MKDIAIFGAGGQGREILLLLHQINDRKHVWNIRGFFDEKEPKGLVNGYPWLGGLPALNKFRTELNVVAAIGNPVSKASVIRQIVNPLIKFPTLIHPSVSISPLQFFEIGEGSIICENVVITTNVTIGRHVHVSPASTLAHDVVIHNFCSLMYAVNLAGNVTLQSAVYIGTNATIIQGLTVGENTIVGAGAVVLKDLPANCTAAGVPAQLIKTHETPS